MKDITEIPFVAAWGTSSLQILKGVQTSAFHCFCLLFCFLSYLLPLVFCSSGSRYLLLISLAQEITRLWLQVVTVRSIGPQ